MGIDRLLHASAILAHLHFLTEPASVEVSFVLKIDRNPVCVDYSTLLEIPCTFFCVVDCKLLKS